MPQVRWTHVILLSRLSRFDKTLTANVSAPVSMTTATGATGRQRKADTKMTQRPFIALQSWSIRELHRKKKNKTSFMKSKKRLNISNDVKMYHPHVWRSEAASHIRAEPADLESDLLFHMCHSHGSRLDVSIGPCPWDEPLRSRPVISRPRAPNAGDEPAAAPAFQTWWWYRSSCSAGGRGKHQRHTLNWVFSSLSSHTK